MATIRPLAPQDRPSLEAFACAVFDQPWTMQAEDMVHLLPDWLESGRGQVIGVFEEERLVAVGAWRIENDPEWNRIDGAIWRSEVIAVQNGFKKRGYARLVKQQMLVEARRGGVVAITSVVHYKNAAMRGLNEKLGGTTRPAMRSAFRRDEEFGWCIIPVRAGSTRLR